MTDVLQPSSERPMLIELAGEIDIASAANLGDCLCQAIDLTRSGLVVDMTAVTFIDSSGMAMMLRVQHAASKQNCTVSWRAIQPFPAKALAIMGLDQVLVLED
jgi:anti-sigma B factor antagonist